MTVKALRGDHETPNYLPDFFVPSRNDTSNSVMTGNFT